MFRGNGIYKLLSVLIAVVLAVYVNAERNPYETRVFSLPVTVQNQPHGTIIKSIPGRVQAQVQGPREAVMQVTPRDLEAVVNLVSRESGVQKVSVEVRPAANAMVPSGVDLRPLEPSIEIDLDSVADRVLPLEPVFLRPPPSGYSYETPEVQPDKAGISGPRQTVQSVTGLQVLINVEALPGRPVSGRFPIQATDKSGKKVSGVEIDPPEARIVGRLTRLPAEKEILVSPDVSGLPAPSHRIAEVTVVPPSVVVSGNTQALAKLNFGPTQEIEVSGATATVVRSVQVLVPEGVTVEGSRRVRVEVRIVPRERPRSPGD